MLKHVFVARHLSVFAVACNVSFRAYAEFMRRTIGA